MSLTAEELSLMQDEAVIWQPDRCEIRRFVPADDAYGGRGDETEATVATDVPCSVETGAGHEQVLQLFGLERESTVFILYFPAGTDVRVRDHIVVTTKSNKHLQVQGVMEPETHEVERMAIATSQTGGV